MLIPTTQKRWTMMCDVLSKQWMCVAPEPFQGGRERGSGLEHRAYGVRDERIIDLSIIATFDDSIGNFVPVLRWLAIAAWYEGGSFPPLFRVQTRLGMALLGMLCAKIVTCAWEHDWSHMVNALPRQTSALLQIRHMGWLAGAQITHKFFVNIFHAKFGVLK